MWNDVWKSQLNEILSNGCFVDKKDAKKDYVELVGHKFTIDDPRHRLISDNIRCVNIFQCVGQFLWITQGNFNVEAIEYYSPQAKNLSSDGVTMIGAYGPRLFGIHHLRQIQHLLNTLDEDLTKRKAVASVYLPQFDQHGKKKEEVPCTLNLQYLIRNDKVNAVTYMRSQDAYNILPYDVFIFTMLQEYVTAYLQNAHEVKLGTYYHFSGSFHIYKRNEAEIRKVLQNQLKNIDPMSEMPPEKLEIQVNQLNDFEEVLRNTVNAYKRRKKQVDFDFFFGMLNDTFQQEYWKQLGLILLCYGSLKLGDENKFKEFNKMLNPLYQYQIQLFLKKLEETGAKII